MDANSFGFNDPQFTFSDPSDPYTPEQAMQQAHAELGRGSANQRDWEKLGYAPPIGLGDFLERDYSVEFLIDRCLVKGASCLIGGASKSLKTTISLHAATALAAGAKFLDRFETRRSRVLFASAESGEAVLQRNVRGMAEMMGVDIRELAQSGQLSMQFWVPRFRDIDMMDYFGEGVLRTKAEVIVLDPLYQSLDGETASNLSMNGEQIQTLIRGMKDLGVTVIVDDHVKRASENAKRFLPIQLEDVSGAGKAEVFRQWILLGRRSQFEQDESLTNEHELWITIGGSAGHNASWGLDVAEEYTSWRLDDVRYSFELKRFSEVKKGHKTTSESEKADREKRAEEQKEKKFDELIDRAIRFFEGDRNRARSKSDLRNEFHCNSEVANQIFHRLLEDKKIVHLPEPEKRGTRNTDVYILSGELPLPPSGDRKDCVDSVDKQ